MTESTDHVLTALQNMRDHAIAQRDSYAADVGRIEYLIHVHTSQHPPTAASRADGDTHPMGTPPGGWPHAPADPDASGIHPAVTAPDQETTDG